MSGIGSLSGIALECTDPAALAAFYTELTGWPVVYASPDWCSIGTSRDADLHLSFQRAPDHRPPVWPDPASSMQFHLHLRVSDLDTAEAAALSLGASKPAEQPNPTGHRVLLDPAGHPFCLVPAPSTRD
jgi:catechol 2,3-dioxygenase-like lactoylglutathione lyase family enzyme